MLLLLFVAFTSLGAENITLLDDEGKEVGKMTVLQFSDLLTASEAHSVLLKIEKEKDGLIDIKGKKEIYLIEDMNNNVEFDILWMAECRNFGEESILHRFKEKCKGKSASDKVEIKRLHISVDLPMKKEQGMSKAREIYRDIAEIATPILAVALGIALALI